MNPPRFWRTAFRAMWSFRFGTKRLEFFCRCCHPPIQGFLAFCISGQVKRAGFRHGYFQDVSYALSNKEVSMPDQNSFRGQVESFHEQIRFWNGVQVRHGAMRTVNRQPVHWDAVFPPHIHSQCTASHVNAGVLHFTHAWSCSDFCPDHFQAFKNSSNAALVTRQVDPIFLPLRSPASSVASTSASLTPKTRAMSDVPSSSGIPVVAAAPVGAAAGVVCCAPMAAIICWPIARPAPSCAAVLAMPPPSPPLPIASAI